MAAPAALLDALIILTGQRLGDVSQQSLDRLYRLKETYKSDIPR